MPPELQEQDDAEYEAAKCPEPHEDGVPCLPTWDGFIYICLHALVWSYR